MGRRQKKIFFWIIILHPLKLHTDKKFLQHDTHNKKSNTQKKQMSKRKRHSSKKKNSETKLHGVRRWGSSTKFQAHITIRSKRISLGIFSNQKKAAKAYDSAAAKAGRPLTHLNYPNLIPTNRTVRRVTDRGYTLYVRGGTKNYLHNNNLIKKNLLKTKTQTQTTTTTTQR